MRKIASALFIAAAMAFATVASAAEPPKGPITLPAKPGNITFEHSKHVNQPGMKCTQCHKTMEGGAIEGFNKTLSGNKIPHATCQGCHKEKGKGPQKCADCHKKA